MTKAKTIPVNLMDNPRFKEFIEAFSRISKAAEELSLDEGRKLGTKFFLSEGTVFEPVHRIENCEVPGRDHHQIPVRVYIPSSSKKLPVMIYFHRGGWVFGNIEEADPVCRKLSNHLERIVVSVGYRLSPENPFPKPLYDCYDATVWTKENIARFGGDPQRLAVCGESAGGNLAAAVSMMARDMSGPSIEAQVLIYPVVSSTIQSTPYDECADKYFLTKETMQFFIEMYLPNPENRLNPYASLDLARDLTGLPPTVVITAEHDPLHQEATDFAKALTASKVPTAAKCFPDMIHGFIDLPVYDENRKVDAIREIGELLATVLQRSNS